MNYRKAYMAIIAKALKEERSKKQDVYYESHHILPKSLFPLWSKKKSNKVLLTAREHFFVHQLLYKIYPSREMQAALWLMYNRLGKPKNSKEYERIKLKMVEQFNVNKLKNANPFPGAKAAGIVNKERLSKKVMCVETGNIYSCLTKAGSLEGVSPVSVMRCVKGKYKTVKGFTYVLVDKEG